MNPIQGLMGAMETIQDDEGVEEGEDNGRINLGDRQKQIFNNLLGDSIKSTNSNSDVNSLSRTADSDILSQATSQLASNHNSESSDHEPQKEKSASEISGKPVHSQSESGNSSDNDKPLPLSQESPLTLGQEKEIQLQENNTPNEEHTEENENIPLGQEAPLQLGQAAQINDAKEEKKSSSSSSSSDKPKEKEEDKPIEEKTEKKSSSSSSSDAKEKEIVEEEPQPEKEQEENITQEDEIADDEEEKVASENGEEPQQLETGLSVDDTVPPLPLRPPAPKFTEEELDRELELFLKSKGKNLPPQEMRRALFQHISRRRVQAIENQQYENGEKLMEVQEKLKIAMQNDMASSDSNYEKTTTEARLKEAKAILKEAVEKWDQKLKELDNDMEEKESVIRYKHDEELDNFTEFWQHPESLHTFNKPSVILLQMRTQEKNMALTGDFKGAKQMKKKADRLQAEETERAQKAATVGMKRQLETLLKKHQKELEGHDRLRHKLTVQAQVQREEELRPLEMAVRKLQNLKENPAIPKRSPPVSKSRLELKQNPDMMYDDRPPVSTPRTMRKLANIRASPRSSTLELKSISTKRAIKKMKPKKPKKEEPEETVKQSDL